MSGVLDSAWLVLIAVLALSVPVCGLVSILNAIVFGPILWLMAKGVKPKGAGSPAGKRQSG
jgi:hypothetical protein